jgi:hypothetical protein
MAGGEDQNPASSSPGLIGEVVGSDEGLTTISFWGLDGGETWPVGAGGGKVAGRALLRCRHDEEQEQREGNDRTGSGLTGADVGAARSCLPQPCLGGDGAVRWLAR